MKIYIFFICIGLVNNSFACYGAFLRWRVAHYQKSEADYAVTKGNRARDISISRTHYPNGAIQRHRKITEQDIDWRLAIVEPWNNNNLATIINNWHPLPFNRYLEALSWELQAHNPGTVQIRLDKLKNNQVIETQYIKVTVEEVSD